MITVEGEDYSVTRGKAFKVYFISSRKVRATVKQELNESLEDFELKVHREIAKVHKEQARLLPRHTPSCSCYRLCIRFCAPLCCARGAIATSAITYPPSSPPPPPL